MAPRLPGIVLQLLCVVACSADEPHEFVLFDDGDRKFTSIAFSPSGTLLAASGSDHHLTLWDLHSRQRLRTFGDETGLAKCLAFGSDDRMLCCGTREGTIAVWHALTGQLVLRHKVPGVSWHSLRQLPNGEWLAAGSSEKSVRLWASSSPHETKDFAGHEFAVQDVVFSQDGNRILSGDFRGHIRIWDLSGTLETGSPDSVAGSICKLAAGPALRLVVIGDSTSALRMCTLPDFASYPLRSYGDEVETVDYLAISPSGRYLAAGIRDAGEIEIWDLAKRKQIANLPGPLLTAVAFKPDGTAFASSDSDGVKLWNMQSIIGNDW